MIRREYNIVRGSGENNLFVLGSFSKLLLLEEN